MKTLLNIIRRLLGGTGPERIDAELEQAPTVQVEEETSMTITLEMLRTVFQKAPTATIAKYVDAVNATCHRFEINTPDRIAAFLSQIGHESAELTAVVENLNYSAAALIKTFPKYFTQQLAEQYARKPEMIASRVYANRMGNGGELSGDGWKYRGRGAIQLTGKNNYQAFANEMGMTLDQVVEYLTGAEGAIMSAGWFWHTNSLNRFADNQDVRGLTRAINGGTNGLAHRQELYEKATQIFA